MLIRKWRERRERMRMQSKKMAIVSCVGKMAALRTQLEIARDPVVEIQKFHALIAETCRLDQIRTTPASHFKPDGSGRIDKNGHRSGPRGRG